MPVINDAGLALIEEFEGCELRSYPDPGTGGAPFTIGFGHTANVHPGQTITQAQAVAFLKEDVSVAESRVIGAVHVTLTPNQFSALVSFEYNTGAPASSGVFQCINANNFVGAMNQLMLWVHAGGVVLPGLVRRREAEKALFLK